MRSRRASRSSPFGAADYEEYVDGKPRADRTRSFLASRGIELPEGHDDDPPDALTVRGLGNRKNETFTRRVREDGVEAYPGSVRYLRAARDAGLRRAVVSSSANCHDVLVGAGIEDMLEVRIDGVCQAGAAAGKPPRYFLAGAGPRAEPPKRVRGLPAWRRAGRAGSGRGGVTAWQAEALKEHGADVVADLPS